MWYVYVVRCFDDSLYTGITTELDRRVEEHNTSKKGAKYTRSRRPVKLVGWRQFKDRSAASIEEAIVKKLKPLAKLVWCSREGGDSK